MLLTTCANERTRVQVQEELDKAFRSYSLAMPGSTSGKEALAIV
jgi:hypothetical protein